MASDTIARRSTVKPGNGRMLVTLAGLCLRVFHLDQQHAKRGLRTHGMRHERFDPHERAGPDLDGLTAQIALAFSTDHIDEDRDWQ